MFTEKQYETNSFKKNQIKFRGTSRVAICFIKNFWAKSKI